MHGVSYLKTNERCSLNILFTLNSDNGALFNIGVFIIARRIALCPSGKLDLDFHVCCRFADSLWASPVIVSALNLTDKLSVFCFSDLQKYFGYMSSKYL